MAHPARADPGRPTGRLCRRDRQALAYDFRGADARLARLATAGAAGVADEITRQAQLARAAMDAVQGRHAATAPRLQVIEGGALAAGDTAGALDALLLRSAVALRLEGATPAQLLMARGDSLGWDRDPALAAASRCRWAAIRSRQGRRDEARRLARTGAALAADAGLRRQAAGCLFILATEFARSGLTDSLRATLVPAMDAQRAAGDLAGLAASSQWAGYYAITLGHFSAAQRYLADAWALAARAQVADVAAWTALNRAALALSFHDAAATRQWMHRADTLMRRLDDPTGRLEVARPPGPSRRSGWRQRRRAPAPAGGAAHGRPCGRAPVAAVGGGGATRPCHARGSWTRPRR
ncbi:MAG: hypothetical protein IPN16_19555 [Gemmatimonadetes bacterium]|nr:hypothetical protein [Gemmatimonadota bacterium]